MTRFFESLGAPLSNSPWSWGARRQDGAIFLRQWESDVFAEDGQEYAIVADNAPSTADRRSLGWKERQRYIQAIRSGSPCFLVIVVAEDVTASPRTVRSFNVREIVVTDGSLTSKRGHTCVRVVDRRPVSEFLVDDQ